MDDDLVLTHEERRGTVMWITHGVGRVDAPTMVASIPAVVPVG